MQSKKDQALKRAFLIVLIAIALFFLQDSVILKILLGLVAVYCLVVLGLVVYQRRHQDKPAVHQLLCGALRPILFIGDFFGTSFGKSIINAGVQLVVVSLSFLLLLFVLLIILETNLIPNDVYKLIVTFFLMVLFAVLVTAEGFERMINRLFKSLDAPYSAEVTRKLVYTVYIILLILATLNCLGALDESLCTKQLDFWKLVVSPAFLTFMAWEKMTR